MKPEKLVTMHCPSCKADFDRQPIIMIDPLKGTSRMELELPRKCRYCGGGLVRRVTKMQTIFEVGKANAENR